MKGVKTGGRAKGTPNKANSTIREQVEQEAGTPLPVVLVRIGMIAMENKDLHLAVTALSKAAAFAYPRVQAEPPPPPDREEVVIYFDDAR